MDSEKWAVPLIHGTGDRSSSGRVWVTVILAVWPLPAFSAPDHPATSPQTYHVDAARGDDRNDGHRPDSAWRSLEQVNRAALRPGDHVLFGRGGRWRGQLVPHSGRPGDPIVYGAFGHGPKPQLLGSVAMDRAEDWHATTPGLWATEPIRFEPVGVPVQLGQSRTWLYNEGGAVCSLRREAAGQGPPVLRVECEQPGTRSNHIQLSISDLSVQEGQDYLVTFRARSTHRFTPAGVAIMRDSAPWTAYAESRAALPVIGEEWTDLRIPLHATHTARAARLTFFLGASLPTSATLLLAPEALVTARSNQPAPLDLDVGNLIFDQGRATGVKKWRVSELQHPGDFVYDARAWQVTLRLDANPATRYRSIELALNRHIIDESGRSHVTYENLDLRYGAAHGVGGSIVEGITVRNCDLSYIGGGHQFTGSDGRPVRFGNGIEFWSDARDSVVEGCRLWEIYDAALTNQGGGTNVQENIIYRRNQIWNCEYSFEFWNRDGTSRTRHIRFEHNTCVNAGSGWGHAQRPDPSGRHLMFYENSSATEDIVIRSNIFSVATDSLLRLHGRDWTAALTMDFNCWYQPTGPSLLWGKETVAADRLVHFLSPRGLDRNSVVANPMFIDPAHQDFRLAPRSPARSIVGDGSQPGALP